MTKLGQKIQPKVNLKGFEPNEQEEIVAMLENIVKEKIYIAILEKLSYDEREELARMNEGQYVEKVTSFLDSKIPEFKAVIEAMMNEVVKEFNMHRAS